MSSSTTPDAPAVKLDNVSKIYHLYGSQTDQLVEVLGLRRLGFRPRTPPKEFRALSNISLVVPRGRRIGIIGRNGAGKTTLLKLICGNFTPTTGSIAVHGAVQALMNMGLGFHQEYTGRENVEAAMQYNGLSGDEYRAAVAGIIEFCELGDFFDQPFKTYSLGMQSRLMFAAATAIKPDILIIDEVLGAGDAYFVAKSKRRVDALVGNGCTMLLVTHAMSQILELCTEAVWLDQGQVRMQGDAFTVVKAYESFLHGPITSLDDGPDEFQQPKTVSRSSAENSLSAGDGRSLVLQEPAFLPHAASTSGLPPLATPTEFKFPAQGGIARWGAPIAFEIVGFSIHTERGETNELTSMRPARFTMTVKALRSGEFRCRYAFVFYTHLGQCVLDILSGEDAFETVQGEVRTISMELNPTQLGPGEYTMSLSVHDFAPIEVFNATRRHDLLSRSFLVRVELPESLRPIEAQFYHTAEWAFAKNGTM